MTPVGLGAHSSLCLSGHARSPSEGEKLFFSEICSIILTIFLAPCLNTQPPVRKLLVPHLFLPSLPWFNKGIEQILHTMLSQYKAIEANLCLFQRSVPFFPSWKMKTSNFILGIMCFFVRFFSTSGNWLRKEMETKNFHAVSLIFSSVSQIPEFSLIFSSTIHFLIWQIP